MMESSLKYNDVKGQVLNFNDTQVEYNYHKILLKHSNDVQLQKYFPPSQIISM